MYAELANEVGDRSPFAKRAGLAVNDHLHAENIVILSYLYNLETIW